jgi:hypothetical protein
MPQEPWVLISEGGSGESRAAVAAVRALATEGYKPAVTVSGDLSLAGSSRYCARRVPVPPASSAPQAYAEAIRRELEAGEYLTVLPASDPAILALGLPVRHLLDKVACAAAAECVGLRVPPNRVFDSAQELLDAARKLTYPLVVKPDVKRHTAIRARSAQELADRLAPWARGPGRLVVQPYISDDLRGLVGLIWHGELMSAMHMGYRRIWPLPCGTVAAAETIAPDLELEERLTRLLSGYDGLFHADIAGEYLLDVNPRVHATLPLALAAGINPVARYCDLLRGRTVARARSRPGVFFRWVEGDVRSIWRSLRERRLTWRVALRALAPRRGTVYSYESWRDPGPLLTRTRYLARRVASRKSQV